MSEGEFKKIIREAAPNASPLVYYGVVAEKLCVALEEARKEFQEWWEAEPHLVEPDVYDAVDNEHYFMDKEEFHEARKEWRREGKDLFLKWFGSAEVK